MSSFQLSGLASGFDWVSFVDQVMELERTPINRMENEQRRNTRQINALNTLNGKIGSFRSSVQALQEPALFQTRTASSSNASFSTRAEIGATTGSFQFAVTQLATASVLKGADNRGAGLSETSDVSDLMVSDLPTRLRITEGTFSVNGAQVEVSFTDSLQDVFDKISAATNGEVTASYDPTTDSISLQSSNEIILGAANDTSNFTHALGLYNNGSNQINGQAGLGITDIFAKLDNARLRDPITAVDAEGNGSFTINGVEISYNTASDSINDIMARINASGAGVRASFEAGSDRMVLTNTRTGDSGLHVSEAAGGFLSAMGLTSGTGANLQRGTNAEFSLNGGPSMTSATNALDEAAHGIKGLTVTVRELGASQVDVETDTSAIQGAIEKFIASYNDVQDFIEEQTRIKASNGNVETSTLSGNREVEAWSRELRSLAFSALGQGVSQITRLESLGIDFRSGTSKLEIRDSTRLSNAIDNQLDDVRSFFSASQQGFARRMDNYLDQLVGFTNTGGALSRQTSRLQSANTSLDQQIERMERQLESRRALLESGFIAMEQAQQRINTMQQQLSQAFPDQSQQKK